MTTWYNVKKEEIMHELCPGVTITDGELINRLDWIEYLNCIRPIVNLKINENEEKTSSLIELMLGNVYRQFVAVTENRIPEIEEVEAYKKSPNVRVTTLYLTHLAMSYTEDTWKEFETDTKQKLGIE